MTSPLDDDLFERLSRAALAETGPGVGGEVFERRGVSVELTEDQDGQRITSARERGLAVRLYRGGRVAFAAGSPARAEEIAEEARRLLPRARTRRGARVPAPQPGETSDSGPLSDPEPPDEETALAVLTAFRQSLATAGKNAVSVREASITSGVRRERIATSAGRAAVWTTRGATLVATVVGRSEGGRFSARTVACASRPEDLPLARLARLAADRVLLPLLGKPAPSGRYDILLDPHVAAHLVGRLAPLFFGDEEEQLLRSRTRSGRDAFASPLISLIDDAQAPGGPVRTTRDAEGTPQGRTLVVERGLPAGRLSDTMAAARQGQPPTGNAVRTSWSSPPRIGVTNFFVDPSPGISPLDLLSTVGKGLYAAVLLERPDVDPAGDRFRIEVAGFLVEKGRATDRVSEASISGRLSALLREVSALGDDLKFVTAAGGGAGSPTLLVPRWKVGG